MKLYLKDVSDSKIIQRGKNISSFKKPSPYGSRHIFQKPNSNNFLKVISIMNEAYKYCFQKYLQ